MASSWKYPTTQVYYIRRVVPKELQPILWTLLKRSLGTKDLAVAKSRFTVALAESEERLLLPVHAHQLASRRYQKGLAQMESSGGLHSLPVC